MEVFSGFFSGRPGHRTLRFTGAGATDMVPSHRTPLPGVRCKRLFGPALARGPDPCPHTPGDARRALRDGGQAVGTGTAVALWSWPVLVVVRRPSRGWSA